MFVFVNCTFCDFDIFSICDIYCTAVRPASLPGVSSSLSTVKELLVVVFGIFWLLVLSGIKVLRRDDVVLQSQLRHCVSESDK